MKEAVLAHSLRQIMPMLIETIKVLQRSGFEIPSAEQEILAFKNAWENTYDFIKAEKLYELPTLRQPKIAYQLVLPKMETLLSVRTGLLCIALGIAFQILEEKEQSQLLDAARGTLTLAKKKTCVITVCKAF